MLSFDLPLTKLFQNVLYLFDEQGDVKFPVTKLFSKDFHVLCGPCSFFPQLMRDYFTCNLTQRLMCVQTEL